MVIVTVIVVTMVVVIGIVIFLTTSVTVRIFSVLVLKWLFSLALLL